MGIYHRNELVFAKGYGLADLESGEPITPQTPFQVGSVSKQFTAFAVALLAREARSTWMQTSAPMCPMCLASAAPLLCVT